MNKIKYTWKEKCEKKENVFPAYQTYLRHIIGYDMNKFEFITQQHENYTMSLLSKDNPDSERILLIMKQAKPTQEDMCFVLDTFTRQKKIKYEENVKKGGDKCEGDLLGEGEFENFPPDYVYIHKEKELVFCFTKDELIGYINEMPPINPYTRVRFTENDIQKIRNFILNRKDELNIFTIEEEKKEDIQLLIERNSSNNFARIFSDNGITYPPLYSDLKRNYPDSQSILNLIITLNSIKSDDAGGGYIFNINIPQIRQNIINNNANPYVLFVSTFYPIVRNPATAMLLKYFIELDDARVPYIPEQIRPEVRNPIQNVVNNYNRQNIEVDGSFEDEGDQEHLNEQDQEMEEHYNGLVSQVMELIGSEDIDELRTLLAENNGDEENYINRLGHDQYDGIAPIHLAAEQGNRDMILLLLQYNANINLPDVTGDTPLKMAIGENQNQARPFVEFLIEHGATVDDDLISWAEHLVDEDFLEYLRNQL